MEEKEALKIIEKIVTPNKDGYINNMTLTQVLQIVNIAYEKGLINTQHALNVDDSKFSEKLFHKSC